MFLNLHSARREPQKRKKRGLEDECSETGCGHLSLSSAIPSSCFLVRSVRKVGTQGRDEGKRGIRELNRALGEDEPRELRPALGQGEPRPHCNEQLPAFFLSFEGFVGDPHGRARSPKSDFARLFAILSSIREAKSRENTRRDESEDEGNEMILGSWTCIFLSGKNRAREER